MRFLLQYRRKYGKYFWIAVVFVTLEAFCDLLQPTLMAKIIDVGVAGKQMDYILHMGGVMLAVTAVGAVAAAVRNIISSRVSQQLGADLRVDLYEKIQSLSFANIDRLDKASLVTRITNDVTQIQGFVNGMMRISLKAPLLCIGGLIMAINLNAELAVVLAAVVPVVILLIVFNMRIGFPLFIQVQNALDRVNSVMREYLAGVRVVKTFNQFGHEEDKFAQANRQLEASSVTAIRMMAAFGPGITLTLNLGIVLVLWLGGIGVRDGHIQVGHIIAFINYMIQILFSLMIISMVFNMFVRAHASAGRIDEVFSQQESMAWNPAARLDAGGFEHSVEFQQVCFAYGGQGSELVLKDIELSCRPGEMVGIIGSTGSGKSTLVHLIPRFYEALSGQVKVQGRDVRELNPHLLREVIAMVPQKSILFSGTILDNLRWGKPGADLADLEAAARLAEAHDFISAFPDGYQTRLGQGGVNLSGGQKQRIAIARALVKKPAILILDDCTSALDAGTEGRIKKAIREIAREVTCLMIAQRITSIRDADKIVVLDNGRIVGIGRHEELLEHCPVYQEIYQSQFGKELS